MTDTALYMRGSRTDPRFTHTCAPVQERVQGGTATVTRRRLVCAKPQSSYLPLSLDFDVFVCGAPKRHPKRAPLQLSAAERVSAMAAQQAGDVLHVHHGAGWRISCTATSTSVDFAHAEVRAYCQRQCVGI